MSRAMSRSGRPPLAGGAAVTDGKKYSKLSRHGLAARRAAERAKLLANLAGDRAGGPATRSAGAPSTPSTPTSPQTRSERYALRSAEKSISKTLGESSSPDGSERYPSGAPAKLVDGDDDDDDDDEDDDDDDEDVDDCSSGGDQRMEFQRRQRDAASSAMVQLKPPPLKIVFQPPTNDPGENNGVVADEPSPADSVMDDMFNAWRCGSCTYQNLGRAKGACNMCNDPHPIRAGLSLDPWEIGELEAHSLHQVAASPPPDDKTSSDECHARQFCVSKSNDPNHFTLCIDCNGEVHMVCADLLFFQKPSKDGFIPKKDLSQHAKMRLRKMSLAERESVYVCLLCQDRIVRQRTSLKDLKAVAKISTSTLSNDGTTRTPKKKAKENCPSSAVLRNLRKLAAFHCYVFMFEAYEKKKMADKWKIMEESFYGDPRKKIKGAIHQLLDGDNAFAALYDDPVVNEKGIVERALKASCCGADTARHYVAGTHFTATMLSTFSDGKFFIGRSLWGFGEEVMLSVKKAISLMPKLAPQICSINKNFAVISFASGKTEDNLISMIDNGMYDMEVKDCRSAVVVDADKGGDELQEQNERLRMDSGVDDDGEDTQSPDNHANKCDPFKGVVAPFGYSYDGKLAFICLGPTTQHFSKVIRLGGSKLDDPVTKKKGSRAAMRKEEEKRNVVDRVVGIERGVSQQSQTTFGLMAQNEESAVQAHRDMRMTGIMKRIENNTQLIQIRMSLWKELDEGEVKNTMMKYISDLLDKGEHLDRELEGMIAEGRNSNPIVNHLLFNAASSMGYKIGAGDEVVGGKTSGEVLADNESS